MAKSILNVVMQGASGKIGKTLVFRQMNNGETVIANRSKPRSKPLTLKEEAHREKFLESSYLAQKLAKDPLLGPQYLTKATSGQSAYSVAMADCLSAPKIKKINLEGYNGAIGDIISVRAIDNFRVEQVKLRIFGVDGMLIEEGLATFTDNDPDWIYVATAEVCAAAGITIEVMASDISGNKTVEIATITSS